MITTAMLLDILKRHPYTALSEEMFDLVDRDIEEREVDLQVEHHKCLRSVFSFPAVQVDAEA